MFWVLGQKSPETYSLQNVFWVCDEFNTPVEDEVKSVKGWLALHPACQPADILERSIWQRGQQAKMKKTNVLVRVFFPNTNHSALQENKCKARPTTFSLLDIRGEGAAMLSNYGENTMAQKTECKVFEGCTALCSTTCCCGKVHSDHKVLIVAYSGTMWRMT